MLRGVMCRTWEDGRRRARSPQMTELPKTLPRHAQPVQKKVKMMLKVSCAVLTRVLPLSPSRSSAGPWPCGHGREAVPEPTRRLKHVSTHTHTGAEQIETEAASTSAPDERNAQLTKHTLS